ncbi:MAG: hypothetical protein ACSHX0_01035 [Akkermansiaceae bacterium]
MHAIKTIITAGFIGITAGLPSALCGVGGGIVLITVAAWFGTDLMHKPSNQCLTQMFGIVLLVFGTKMLLGK